MAFVNLRQLRIENVTRFSRVEVDFESAGEGLFAILGPNGAGKTTLLECSGVAALYREFATRPESAVKNYVRGQGSLFLSFEDSGISYEVEQLFPAKGIHTAYLKADGVQLATGRLADFDREVLERFGPKDAFLVSAFAAQGGGGRFATMGVAERKGLFRYLLQLDRLAAIHDSSKAMLARIDLTEIDRLEAEQILVRRREFDSSEAYDQFAIDLVNARNDLQALEETDLSNREALAQLAPWKSYDEQVKNLVEKNRELGAAKGQLGETATLDSTEARSRFEALLARKDEIAALDRDLQRESAKLKDRKVDLQQAKSEVEKVAEVPCKSAAPFAKCRFLVSAIEAQKLLRSDNGQLAEDLRDHDARSMLARTEQEAHTRELKQAKRAVDEAREPALKAARLQGQIDSLTAQIAELRKRALDLRRTLPKERPTIEVQPVNPAEIADARASIEAIIRAQTKAKVEHEAACRRDKEIRGEIEQRRSQIAEAEALKLLVKAFGPGGIQAMEIDASGPAVAGLANALLRGAYGDRFSIEIRTQRELKTQRGMGETFDILVTDAERGRTGQIASLSGGEQVVVDEALRNALAMFSADLGIRQFGTTWRDETTSALYGESIARYGNMLQTARKLGGLSRVLFVGGEAGADAADKIIHISEDGQVTVE